MTANVSYGLKLAEAAGRMLSPRAWGGTERGECAHPRSCAPAPAARLKGCAGELATAAAAMPSNTAFK